MAEFRLGFAQLLQALAFLEARESPRLVSRFGIQNSHFTEATHRNPLCIDGIRQGGDRPSRAIGSHAVLLGIAANDPDLNAILEPNREVVAVRAERNRPRAIEEVRFDRLEPLAGLGVPHGRSHLAFADQHADCSEPLAVRRPDQLLAGGRGKCRAARFVLIVESNGFKPSCGVVDADVEPEVRGIVLAIRAERDEVPTESRFRARFTIGCGEDDLASRVFRRAFRLHHLEGRMGRRLLFHKPRTRVSGVFESEKFRSSGILDESCGLAGLPGFRNPSRHAEAELFLCGRVVERHLSADNHGVHVAIGTELNVRYVSGRVRLRRRIGRRSRCLGRFPRHRAGVGC